MNKEKKCGICGSFEEAIKCEGGCRREVCKWRPCVEEKDGEICRDCYKSMK